MAGNGEFTLFSKAAVPAENGAWLTGLSSAGGF
jgi:hypothetical protein